MSGPADPVGGPGDGGPRLIGGEMLAFSDVRAGGPPPAGGPLLAHLAARVSVCAAAAAGGGGRAGAPGGGRVLVAGPHQPDLVAALAAGTREVSWLLRSLPDAAAAASATGVRVLCGTLPKLAEDGRYGLVVALDGLDRLCSAEGPQYDWRESLRALARALAPGGALLVAVGNELGVHRLVAPRPAGAERTSAQWHAVGEADPARPGTPQRLAGELRAAGLHPVAGYAAWPLPPAPTVLAERVALADPDLAGPLAAIVAAACASGFAGGEVLTDPRRLAAAGVRAGLGAELAPAWVAIATRPADAAPPSRVGWHGFGAPPAGPGASPAGPAALVPVLTAEFGGPVVEITDAGDGWRRRLVAPDTAAHGGAGAAPVAAAEGGAGAAPVAAAEGGAGAAPVAAHRDPSRLAGPLPRGRLLEELLLAACLRADLPALRRLLRGYASWLGGLPAGHAATATVANVLLDGERFAVLDPSWSVPAEPAVATVRALRRFADDLIAGAHPHPWPVSDVEGLTVLLAATAGVGHDADTLRRAALLDDAAPDRRPPPDPLWGGPAGRRERAELLRQLRAQLDEAAARARRYERELVECETELRRAHLLIAAFSGSPAYRLVRLGRAAAGRIRRLAGRAGRAAARALTGGGPRAPRAAHPPPDEPPR